MASVTLVPIVLGVFFFTSSIICSSLLSMRLVTYCKKKQQIPSASKRAIVLSLLSMSLFTFSLFLYALHFIIFVVHGRIIQLDFFNNVCYLSALITASYVWIQRLEDTFHNSVHGYSAKYIRNLRIFWFVTSLWAFLGCILHFTFVSLGLSNLRWYSVVHGVFFILFIISLFITVLCSFIRKMKQSLQLTVRVASSSPRPHQMHSISNELLQLVVKYTVLSVLCIGSTLCAFTYILVFLVVGFPTWHWMQISPAIDDCIGFITMYCAWGNNKAYYTLCACVHSLIIKHKGEPPPRAAPDMTDGDTICTAPGLSVVQSSDLHRPNSV
eukprot:217118_1